MARGSRGNWFGKHTKDPYVKKAQKDQYRSRAAYKLEAIDKKDKLIRPGMHIIDIGAAPGAWSQYVRKKTNGKGTIIAIDLLDMSFIQGVDFIKGDITEEDCLKKIEALLAKNSPSRKADLVISDIAPNITGIKERDAAAYENIWLAVVPLVLTVIKPGGYFLAKVFAGLGDIELRDGLKKHGTVQVRKPQASRSESREYYVLWQSHNL